MKDTPILFNGPMVRAQQAGTKTQTRRLVKPQPSQSSDTAFLGEDGIWRFSHPTLRGPVSHATDDVRCPYGRPGDRLWVRELVELTTDGCEPGVIALRYPADGEIVFPDAWPAECDGLVEWINGRWSRPSIHMPLWASRITLEITGVRVERLGDISREDAEAEGVGLLPVSENDYRWIDYTDKDGSRTFGDPRQSFWSLWKSINGADSWAANPWVWVIDFQEVVHAGA